MNQVKKVYVPRPPKELFQGREGGASEVQDEKRPYPFVDHYEYPPEGGIYAYQYGADWEYRDGEIYISNKVPLKHPIKGFPHAETILACNIAKRFLLTQIKLYTDKTMWWMWLGLLLYPKKWKVRWLERWLEFYTQSLERILPQFFLQDKLQMKVAKEVGTFVYNLLKNWGITNERLLKEVGQIFNAFIENDTAYRFRLEDLTLETTKELMTKDPYREVTKLYQTLCERDKNEKVRLIFGKFKLLLKVFLLMPSAKQAFVKAIQDSEFRHFQMDEADHYHTLNQCGYKFGGREDDDRFEEYKKIHGCACNTTVEGENVCICGKIPKLYYFETLNEQVNNAETTNPYNNMSLTEEQKLNIDQATKEIQEVLDKHGLTLNITPVGYNITLLPKPEAPIIQPVEQPIIVPDSAK